MNQLMKELNSRQRYLTMLLENIQERQEKLHCEEADRVQIRKCRNNTQYYVYNSKTRSSLYVKRKDECRIIPLIERDYLATLQKTVEKELYSLNQYLAWAPFDEASRLYTNLSPERRRLLINPLVPSYEEAVRQWKEIPWKGKEFANSDASFITQLGERVRSKSEKIIADLLAQHQIPYKYECPLTLMNANGTYYTVFPDFTILDVTNRKEIIWEHFGLMNEPDYATKANSKINAYYRNGYLPGDRLIMTFEGGKNTLDSVVLEQIIRQLLPA